MKEEEIHEKKETEPGLLGVSVYHFTNHFLLEVRAEFGNSAEACNIHKIEDLRKFDQNGIIRQKGQGISCPIDGRPGAAYVHTLEHANHVGRASIMLSYTWEYTIGDIIDVLTKYCTSNNLDQKKVYVWICCLCVNQHRVVERKKRGEVVPSDQFREVFYERVTKIGHVLAMMSPWTEPAYLRRVWCIFELFTASKRGCKITIEMPSKERTDFLNGISNMSQDMDFVKKLFDALSRTNIESAKASVESDKVDILKIIQNETSFDHFNATINHFIRRWVIRLVRDALNSRFDPVRDGSYDKQWAIIHGRLGILFHRIGEFEQALDMFKVELKMCEEEFGSSHIRIAHPLNNIALTLKEQANYEDALYFYNRSLVITEKEFGRDHTEMALIFNNIGGVYASQDESTKALEIFNQALTIRKQNIGQHHELTATTLMNIATVLGEQGNFDEASEKYEQVLPIFEEKYGRDSVEIASLMHNAAVTLSNQQKYKDAMEKYLSSLAIYTKVLGMNHQETLNVRENIAVLENEMQMFEKTQISLPLRAKQGWINILRQMTHAKSLSYKTLLIAKYSWETVSGTISSIAS